MKITFTIELDKELTENFQTPFNKITEQISNFVKSLKNSSFTVQEEPAPEKSKKSSKQPDIEPEIKNAQARNKQNKKVKKSKTSKRKSATSKKSKKTVVTTVLETIKAHGEGINSENLKTQTGLNAKQIADTVYRLKRAGLIQKTEEGLFIVV